jgi:uncharacterized protein
MTHELRRNDLEIMDLDEICRLLSSARYASVALVDGDRPYLVTLSCGYDREHDRLCFHVARAGRKLDVIASNPRACATVVHDLGYMTGECAQPYASVVVFGTLRVLEDPEEARQAMRILITQLESEVALEGIWERNRLDTDAGIGRCIMLGLDIEERTAKSGQ